MRPRAPAFPESAWPEQVVASIATTIVVAVANVVYGWLTNPSETALETAAFAGLHLIAMALPLGILFGSGSAFALWLIRTTPGLKQLTRLGGPRQLFRRNPVAFGTSLSMLLAVGAFFVTAQREALHFATKFHNPALASYAMAIVMVVALASSVLLIALLRKLLIPLSHRLGPFASLGVLLILAIGAGIGLTVWLAIHVPSLFVAYPLEKLVWLPGAVLVYAIAVLVLRGRSRTAARPGRFVLAIAGVALSAGGLVASGASYGERNQVRSFVEHHTAIGQSLVRSYVRLTDRDSDGYAFAFGGGDCNDSRSDVYPGAADPEGDGVDSDCFDGDGSREVADLASGGYSPRPAHLDRPNILLITIDALRADHLGCYGYEREVSLHLDRLCAEAVRFSNVIAPSSRSIRSIPAMMTGFYPSQIAYGPEFIWPTLELENETLAESLRNAGYQTAVIMGTDYFTRSSHFFQGFRHARQIPIYIPPRSQVMDEALPQLERLVQHDAPWFLWVHLFNVHEPYLHDQIESRFGDEPMDAYDTEIWLADQQVRRLMAALREHEVEDNTIVVFTSDHGEAFGEHNNMGHSFTIYEEELRAPLLIRVPGLEPRVVEETVSLIDLMPTLLNLADVPVPRPMPARSLLGLMTGQNTISPDRYLYSELMPDGLFPFDQKSIRQSEWKLIWWTREGTIQLFNLETDPGERDDLSDEHPDITHELHGVLRAWVSQTNRPDNRQSDVVDRNRLEREPAELTRRLNLSYPNRFTVLGFDLPKTRYRPGEAIEIDFYYRVDGDIEEDLFFQVDIVGPPGYRLPAHFHGYHFPMNGRYHTDQWQVGEILRDPVQIIIPREIQRPITLNLRLRVVHDRRPLVFEGGDSPNQWMQHLTEIEVL